MPVGAEVNSDRPWIQFREVSGAGIGQQSVLDEGARQAIDIWGPLGVNTEVCFAGMGSMLLLDAAYSPRLRVPLESYLRSDGKTCAHVYRAGTVVLMPGSPSVMPAPATPTPRAVPTYIPFLIRDSLDDMIVLEDCVVNANSNVLRFRASPAGRSLRLFRGSSPALARTPNWFKISYLGREGWISAHYVTTSGDCG